MDFNKALFAFIKVAFSIMIALIVIYAAVKICSVGYDFGYRVFTEPAISEGPGEDIMVEVTDDMSASDIGHMLETKGLVKDGNLFFIQLKLSAYSKKIKSGVYTLNTSMTSKDMMVEMSKSKDKDKNNAGSESDENTESVNQTEVQTE